MVGTGGLFRIGKNNANVEIIIFLTIQEYNLYVMLILIFCYKYWA